MAITKDSSITEIVDFLKVMIPEISEYELLIVTAKTYHKLQSGQIERMECS